LEDKQLQNVFETISKSKRLPIIFAGAGLAKRYTTNSFDWKGLLIQCISQYDDDPVNKYKEYKEDVEHDIKYEDINKFSVNERIGSLIERDFNKAYYRKKISGFPVAEHQSPLKVYISSLLKTYEIKREMSHEVELLGQLQEKMLTILTTNYDTFFEDIVFRKHEKIIGQQVFKKSELGTILKIHGCVTEPESLVLTHRDYEQFKKRRKVLSAKILNLFTENPVIFMGYSVSDENIKSILIDIFQCLETEPDIKSFEERLVMVVYDENVSTPIIGTHSMLVDDINISMTKITLADFTPLLVEMNKLKRITNLKDIQHIRDLVYEIVETTEGSKSKLVNLVNEDEDYSGEEIVVAITKRNDIIRFTGANQINRNDIIKDIIFDDLPAIQEYKWIYEHILPRELKGSAIVPVHKYISNLDITEVTLDESILLVMQKSEEDLLNRSIRKDKDAFEKKNYESLKQIYSDNSIGKSRRVHYLVLYAVYKASVQELREFLKGIYDEFSVNQLRTYLNKMAIILDIKENKKHR